MKKTKAWGKKIEKNQFSGILAGGWQRTGMGATKQKGDNGVNPVPHPFPPLKMKPLDVFMKSHHMDNTSQANTTICHVFSKNGKIEMIFWKISRFKLFENVP